MKRSSLYFSALIALLGISLAGRPAAAVTTIFTPIAGNQFQPSFYPTIDLYPVEGTMVNLSTTFTENVWASLGRANEGTYSFTVYGFANGSTFSCFVKAVNPVNLTTFTSPYIPVRSITGPFSNVLTVTAPAASVGYYFSIFCSLPHKNGTVNAAILGVKPNQ